MPRLSKLIERLEDRIEKKCAGWPQHLKEIYGRWFASLQKRAGSWYARHKEKLPFYIPTGLVLWYFYGMLGQFTRNYTQTTKRRLLTTNKG